MYFSIRILECLIVPLIFVDNVYKRLAAILLACFETWHRSLKFELVMVFYYVGFW